MSHKIIYTYLLPKKRALEIIDRYVNIIPIMVRGNCYQFKN